MRKLGHVTVLAPDRNWSGGGHVKTLDRALRVREVQLADGTCAFASDGAPSDCVALATLGFFKEPIERNYPLVETVLRVKEAGGFCIAAHPMASGMGMKSLSAHTIIKSLHNPGVAETLSRYRSL